MGLLSIYAAVISTLVGAWVIYGVWRDRDALKLDVLFGYVDITKNPPVFLTTPHRRNVSDDDTRIVLRARNTGRRPLSLAAGGFRHRITLTIFSGDGSIDYPIILTEGREGVTWSRLSTVKRTLKKDNNPLIAYFESESGHTYKGKIPRAIRDAIREDS